jgi:hypothetical protein
LFSLAFFSKKHLLKARKKRADKESSAKVETKGADKKRKKPYKKVIDSTAVTQED